AAAELRAGHVQHVAQRPQQRHVVGDIEVAGLSVYVERDHRSSNSLKSRIQRGGDSCQRASWRSPVLSADRRRASQAVSRCRCVDAASGWPLMNAIRSRLTMSGSVWQTPCGLPGYTLNVACLTSFAERGPESANGTIWSSSPCRISVGTSIAFRSSVKSVSENALMQSYCAFAPPIIPWRHQL